MRKFIAFTICGLVLLATNSAQATLLLTFDSSSYVTTSGGTVTADLVLTIDDVVTPDGTTHLFPAGITSGGGRIVDAGGTATLTSAGVSLAPGSIGGTLFPPAPLPPLPGTPLGGVISAFPAVGFMTTSISLVVGSIDIVATGAPGDVSTIAIGEIDLAPLFAENSNTLGTNLDPLLAANGFGTATITIIPVPEPSGMLMLALASVAFGVRRRRS